MKHLKAKQKQALLSWIAEGLETDEINERAAEFRPPFEVSRRVVAHYRKTRGVRLAALTEANEQSALTTGLALREERVKRLQRLAELMEGDLFGDVLWTENQKMIGAGPFARVVDYEEFNAAEVQQYRGVLEDIAKEMGDRRTSSTNTNVTIDVGALTDEQLARIVAGEDPLKVVGGG